MVLEKYYGEDKNNMIIAEQVRTLDDCYPRIGEIIVKEKGQ